MIGPSRLEWRSDALEITFQEVGMPVPVPLRGRVRLSPLGLADRSFALDAAGQHEWAPIAPCARVEVELDAPDLAWSGSGYLDTNAGSEPLEDGFARWSWSRSIESGGSTIFYDLAPRDGARRAMALRIAAAGSIEEAAPPPEVALPATRWRIGRTTRADGGREARVIGTLEDTPFYARSLVGARMLGAQVAAFHESLDLDRFARRWVQALLPFRMPRRVF